MKKADKVRLLKDLKSDKRYRLRVTRDMDSDY